jgi:hypothetical protein
MAITKTRKRPVLLSIVTITGFIFTVFQFCIMMMPSIRKVGLFAPALYGLLVTITFIALIGIWHMKRWGVEMLLYVAFAKALYLSLINELSFSGIFFLVLLIAGSLPYYKRMDRNL